MRLVYSQRRRTVRKTHRWIAILKRPGGQPQRDLGCNRADSTLDGFGRGAGNCPTELLIGFLKNPKFKLKPIIDMLQQHVLPLHKTVDWGPNVAYNLTGKYNRHPRAAMQWLAGETPDDYTAFYDQFVSDI